MHNLEGSLYEEQRIFDDEVLQVIEDPELEALKQKLNELGIDMFPCFDGDTYDIDNDIEMARDCICIVVEKYQMMRGRGY